MIKDVDLYDDIKNLKFQVSHSETTLTLDEYLKINIELIKINPELAAKSLAPMIGVIYAVTTGTIVESEDGLIIPRR